MRHPSYQIIGISVVIIIVFIIWSRNTDVEKPEYGHYMFIIGIISSVLANIFYEAYLREHIIVDD